jgi:hypothetical protein
MLAAPDLDTVRGSSEEVSRMLTWTVRTLMAMIASAIAIGACSATAGALATAAGGAVVVAQPGNPAPVVIPSPERPDTTPYLVKEAVMSCVV